MDIIDTVIIYIMKKNIHYTIHTLALLVAPFAVFAHGGVDDGHVEDVAQAVVTTKAGASALLPAFAPAWWALLFVSLALTSLLSYVVWKYLQVPDTTAKNTKS